MRTPCPLPAPLRLSGHPTLSAVGLQVAGFVNKPPRVVYIAVFFLSSWAKYWGGRGKQETLVWEWSDVWEWNGVHEVTPDCLHRLLINRSCRKHGYFS